jgi:hypothetical protein
MSVFRSRVKYLQLADFVIEYSGHEYIFIITKVKEMTFFNEKFKSECL